MVGCYELNKTEKNMVDGNVKNRDIFQAFIQTSAKGGTYEEGHGRLSLCKRFSTKKSALDSVRRISSFYTVDDEDEYTA